MMEPAAVILSQYRACLKTARLVIEKCPPDLWNRSEDQNPTWRIAYHALFYTHLYLQPALSDFRPWAKHRRQVEKMGEQIDPAAAPYSPQEIGEYLDLLAALLPETVDRLDLAGPSGFQWLPFNKLELQFYNIRHIQQHLGELSERLGRAGVSIDWVSMAG